MTTTSGGNLSIRDEDDIWISPARVDKGNLSPKDIVCVKADGSVEGLHSPSSEFPFHRAAYEARPDIRAIVHAHPVALVAFSICGQTPDTRLFHQAHSECGRIGFAPYALPGSEQLGRNIAETFKTSDSVILENHGVVVGGNSLSHAFQRFEAFEFAAKTIIKGRQLGEVRYLSDSQLDQARNRSVALESFQPPPATANEKDLRSQLREFVRRGCRQRLLISTEGSFSARLGEDAFVITPTQQDRESLDVADFVLVQGECREAGKRASRAVFAHQAIYRKHPNVQAIVFAHPVNATAFSVTDSTFDARTIPESYVFLRDVGRVPYGVHYRDNGAVADFVSEASPVAMLENDGALVTGSSVLDAFDRLEVLESTSEALINAGALGPVAPMSDEVINELRALCNLPPL
jgi:L-fuculose-phosphate aldolase